ncbi:peptidoglycan editing factor PgeF [Corynebacterium incognita]|nr:peptidoglycan editing factor PgeF [Corynebacterium incognita]
MSVNEESTHDVQQRPVRMVFTSRAGGVSASPYDSFNLGDHVGDAPESVAANRQRLQDILGLEHIVWMEQLHTPNVTVVDGTEELPIPATDAVVTTTPGVGLGVLVADCVPVLLADSTAKVVGAAHAGRLGARNGIVAKTVAAMQALGATPAGITALLGPAASGKHYELPKEIALDVESKLPGSLATTAKGTTGLDLRAGLVRQLLSLGVTNIDADPRCTIEDKDFFSYRREGTTGRQAGVVWINDQR